LRIIAMMIQAILRATANKGKKAAGRALPRYLGRVSKEKDLTWEPLENLHGHEELVSDYEV